MTSPNRPKITLIAALDQNRAIGRGNDLPWKLPADMQRFKDLTVGKPVIMGTKTAQSLRRALPNRRNLVITRQNTVPFDGMEACASLEEALERVSDVPEVMVIGGGQIYALALPYADALLLTHVYTEIDGADAFFPEFNLLDWRYLGHVHHMADEKHAFAFAFADYKRRMG